MGLLCVVLAGCATPSSITLTDGIQLQALDTPVYEADTGFYRFEQRDGEWIRINKADIKTIKDL